MVLGKVLCNNINIDTSKSISLNCVSWNVQSLNNKCDEVMEHVLDFNADLVFLCELWLKTDNNAVTAKIKDYNYLILHNIRKSSTKNRGGGVGLLYSNRLQVKKDRSVKGLYESFEYAVYSLKLKTGFDKILLVSFYRCQEVGVNIFLDEFTSLLEKLVTICKNILLAGDINIHCESDDDSSRKLHSSLSGFDLVQNVQDPTNKFGHTVDVVISSSTLPVTNLEVHDVSLSDHYLVSYQFSCSAQLSEFKHITYRNLNGIDKNLFYNEITTALGEIQFDGTFSDTVLSYNNILTDLLNRHAPRKTRLIKTVDRAPWFNQEYAELRRDRRRAEKQYRRSKLEVDRQIFVNLRKKTTNAAFSMKKQFIKSNIRDNKNNSKELYKKVNKLTDKAHTTSLPSISDDNEVLAEMFSEYFKEKTVRIRSEIGQNFSSSSYISNFPTSILSNSNGSLTVTNNRLSSQFLSDFAPTDIKEVKGILLKHGIKTSYEDPLPDTVVKENLDLLLPLWVKLINKSLSSGNFDGFKQAIVTPLIKDNGLDHNDFKNYRPISNLPFLSKLIERIVLSRLNHHMRELGCEVSNQYGYKPAHNTESLLIKITNDLLIASDAKSATVLLLLDLSSAFDTVDKVKLINILSEEIKITGNALNWFKSYLFGRTQKVKIGDNFSDSVIIEFGVPQGSVLGPVLFNIYLRSLYGHIEHLGFSIKGFADDHQLYASFTPDFQLTVLSDHINKVLSAVMQWMKNLFLKLNPEKTQIIVFGRPEVLDNIIINGIFVSNKCIRFVKDVKNLGFHLDDKLSYDKQINELVKSCFLSVRNISSIKQFLGYEEKRILISSFVLSKIDYCNAMYFGLNSHNMRKLQSVQNSAARLVFGSRTYSSLSPLFEKLHWLPIKNRIIFKISIYVHKCLYGNAPDDMMELIQPSDTFIRTAKLKSVIKPETAIGCKAFAVVAPKVWNSLSLQLRQETILVNFKKQLKTYLFKDSSCTHYENILHP